MFNGHDSPGRAEAVAVIGAKKDKQVAAAAAARRRREEKRPAQPAIAAESEHGEDEPAGVALTVTKSTAQAISSVQKYLQLLQMRESVAKTRASLLVANGYDTVLMVSKMTTQQLASIGQFLPGEIAKVVTFREHKFKKRSTARRKQLQGLHPKQLVEEAKATTGIDQSALQTAEAEFDFDKVVELMLEAEAQQHGAASGAPTEAEIEARRTQLQGLHPKQLVEEAKATTGIDQSALQTAAAEFDFDKVVELMLEAEAQQHGAASGAPTEAEIEARRTQLQGLHPKQLVEEAKATTGIDQSALQTAAAEFDIDKVVELMLEAEAQQHGAASGAPTEAEIEARRQHLQGLHPKQLVEEAKATTGIDQSALQTAAAEFDIDKVVELMLEAEAQQQCDVSREYVTRDVPVDEDPPPRYSLQTLPSLPAPMLKHIHLQPVDVFNDSIYTLADEDHQLYQLIYSDDVTEQIVQDLVEDVNVARQGQRLCDLRVPQEIIKRVQDLEPLEVEDLRDLYQQALDAGSCRNPTLKAAVQKMLGAPSFADEYIAQRRGAVYEKLRAIVRPSIESHHKTAQLGLRLTEYDKLLGDLTDPITPAVVTCFHTNLSGDQLTHALARADRGFFELLSPHILASLKLGAPLNKLTRKSLFQDDEYLTGLSGSSLMAKTLWNCNRLADISIMGMYAVQGLPAPLLWRGPPQRTNTECWRCPVSAFYSFFLRPTPSLISLGIERKIGKSVLLNKIVAGDFSTSDVCVDHDGIEFLPTTQDFTRGAHVMDLHGSVLESPAMIKVALEFSRDSWVLVHLRAMTPLPQVERLSDLLYRECGARSEQILLVIRDYEPTQEKKVAPLAERLGITPADSPQILTLPTKPDGEDEVFNTKFLEFLRQLMEHKGDGDQPKFPPGCGDASKIDSHDFYLQMESRVERLRDASRQGGAADTGLHLDLKVFPQEGHDFAQRCRHEMEKCVSDHGTRHEQLLPFLCAAVEKSKVDRKFKQKPLETREDRQKRTRDHAAAEVKIDRDLAAKIQTDTCGLFNLAVEAFQDKVNYVEKISAIAMVLQQQNGPNVDPLLKELSRQRAQCADIETRIEQSRVEAQSPKQRTSAERATNTADLQRLEHERKRLLELIKEQDGKVNEAMVTFEHVQRELAFARERKVSPFPPGFSEEDHCQVLANLMCDGWPLELLDGDTLTMHEKLLQPIYRCLDATVDYGGAHVAGPGARRPAGKPLFVSVLGPQSSGKSTLMNFLFGSRFAASAGRCTKGVYSSVMQTKGHPDCPLVVSVDSEGLLSIERSDPEYDRKITLFLMAMTQVVLINIKGELNASMTNIISLAVYALKKMLDGNKNKPKLIFVLRDMTDLDPEKSREMIMKIQEEMERACREAKVALSEVVDFSSESSFFLMPSAYKIEQDKRKVEYKGSNTELHIARKRDVADLFRDRAQELQKIILTACDSRSYSSLHKWSTDATATWTQIQELQDLVGVDRVIELEQRKQLNHQYERLMSTLKADWDRSLTRIKRKCATHEDFSADDATQEATGVLDGLFRHAMDEFRACFTSDESLSREQVERYEENFVRAKQSYRQAAQQDFEMEKSKSGVDALVGKAKSSMSGWIEEKVHAISTGAEVDTHWETLQSTFDAHWETQRRNLEQQLSELFGRHNPQDQVSGFFEKIALVLPPSDLKYTVQHVNESDAYMMRLGCAPGVISAPAVLDKKMKATSGNIDRYVHSLCAEGYQYISAEINDHGKQGMLNHSTNCLFKDVMDAVRIVRPDNQVLPPRVSAVERQQNQKTKKSAKRQGRTNRTAAAQDPAMGRQGSRHQPTIQEAFYEFQDDFYMAVEIIGVVAQFIRDEAAAIDPVELNTVQNAILKLNEQLDKQCKLFEDERGCKITPVSLGLFYRFFAHKLTVRALELHARDKAKILKQFDDQKDPMLRSLKAQLSRGVKDKEQAGSDMNTIWQQAEPTLQKCGLEKLVRKNIRLGPDDLQAMVDAKVVNPRTPKAELFMYATKAPVFMEKVYKDYMRDKYREEADAISQEMHAEAEQIYNVLEMRCEACSTALRTIGVGSQALEIDQVEKARDFVKQMLSVTESFNEVDTAYESLCTAVRSRAAADKTWRTTALYHEPTGRCFRETAMCFAFQDPVLYLKYFDADMKAKRYSRLQQRLRLQWEQALESGAELQRQIANHEVHALGCRKECPYCGAKCNSTVPQHTNHRCCHRIPAFKGCWEMDTNKDKQWVVDVCGASVNFEKKWYLPPNFDEGQESPELLQRISEHTLGQGKMCITLLWGPGNIRGGKGGANDLDLHVKTASQGWIYYGSHKCQCKKEFISGTSQVRKITRPDGTVDDPQSHKCPQATADGAYLQLDMNAGDANDAKKPCEHILWPDRPPLDAVEIYVNLYSVKDSVEATKYEVHISEGTEGARGRRIAEPIKGTITQSDGKKLVHTYTPGIDFQDHKAKVAPQWEIVRADDQAEVEAVKEKQLAALRKIDADLRQHYGMDR